MRSCDPKLCPSQLRTWRSPLIGGGGRLSRSTSHRDKRYTKGSAETRTAGLRGWSITLGHDGSLTLCRSFRPVHVWISPSGPPLCHNTTFRPGGFPVLLASWYARATGRSINRRGDPERSRTSTDQCHAG